MMNIFDRKDSPEYTEKEETKLFKFMWFLAKCF